MTEEVTGNIRTRPHAGFSGLVRGNDTILEKTFQVRPKGDWLLWTTAGPGVPQTPVWLKETFPKWDPRRTCMRTPQTH